MKRSGMGSEILTALALEEASSAIQIENFEVQGLSAKVRLRIVSSAEVAKEDLVRQLNAKFKGSLRAVANSFRLVDSNGADASSVVSTVVGYVVPNVEIVTASEATGRMKEVASNMFMDEADNIWSQAGDLLYKKSGIETSDSLTEMLTECSSEGAAPSRLRKCVDFDSVEASAGDFVTYMSKGEMLNGFVVAKDQSSGSLIVLASTDDSVEVISTFAVQASVSPKEDELKAPLESEIAGGAVSVSQLVQYYKRLYAYNAAYFAQIENRIKGYSFI